MKPPSDPFLNTWKRLSSPCSWGGHYMTRSIPHNTTWPSDSIWDKNMNMMMMKDEKEMKEEVEMEEKFEGNTKESSEVGVMSINWAPL